MKDIKDNQQISYEIFPIGYVRRNNNRTYLEILEKYKPALQELQNFSHAQIFWWCNKFEDDQYRQITEIDPPFEAPKLGVFASRSPVRPNPIALTTIKILKLDKEKGIIEIPKIDAFDGTPILDIKAYMPCYNKVKSPRVPVWASNWPEWMPDDGLDLDEMPK